MRSMRLLPKLLLLLLIPVVIIMGGMVFTAYMQAKESMVEQVKGELLQVAKMQRDDLENIFTIFRGITVNFSTANRIIALLSAVKEGDRTDIASFILPVSSACVQLSKDFPRIRLAGVIDTQGLVRAHSTKSSVGAQFGEREYFKKVMRTGAPATSMVFSHTTGMLSTIIAAPVMSPTKADEILGVVFIGIDMQSLADATVNKIKVGATGFAFGMDKKGVIVLGVKDSMGKDIGKEPWVAEMVSGSEGLISYTDADVDKIAAYGKVSFVDYTVAVTVPTAEVLVPVMSLRQNLFLLGVSGLILLGLIIFFVVRSLTKPLGVMASTAQEVAGGNWNIDPAQQSHIFANKGEVEAVYKAFSQMLVTLKEKIFYYESILDSIVTPLSITDMDRRWVFVNRECEKVLQCKRADVVGKHCSTWNSPICNTDQCGIACLHRGQPSTLLEMAGKRFDLQTTYITNLAGDRVGHVEVLNDITEVSQAREKAENALHEGMLSAAAQLEGVVDVVSSASTQLATQLEQSEKGAAEQAERVAETATAMDQMNATVLEVAKSAEHAAEVSLSTRKEAETGAEVVQKSVSSIQIVQTQAHQLKQDMSTLDENARAISQIMSVISDIADQTNLLALNAAIEAARAGEAGRGFAVVADEVRKLAEKTMASTTDVAKAVAAIQSSTAKSMAQVDASAHAIEEATRYAYLSGEALKKIVEMVDISAEQVRGIATASEEQSATSENITLSLNHVNNIAAETARAMQEAANAVGELSHQAQGLTVRIASMKNS